MRCYFLLFALASSVALVLGQPAPCVSPQIWQGRLFEVDPSKAYDRLAMIYYNATGKKVAIHEEESEGQQREFYDEIALYEKKVLYRINRRTGECTTTSLDTPFRPIAVPSNATYYGTYYVGSTADPLAGFKVNSFGGDTENGRYVGTWSYVKCVPVTDSYFGEQTGFVHWSFYDVELSIEDPDVFIPPSGCHQ